VQDVPDNESAITPTVKGDVDHAVGVYVEPVKTTVWVGAAAVRLWARAVKVAVTEVYAYDHFTSPA
jgi:hypothetical protein